MKTGRQIIIEQLRLEWPLWVFFLGPFCLFGISTGLYGLIYG